MAIEELAKKYANAIPNFKLAKYYEAAIPQYRMEMVLVMEKEKTLSVLQEFVLKFIAEGVDEISIIGKFLGINISTVHRAVAELQKAELLTLDISFKKVRLTEKGREALRSIKTIVPEEVEYTLFMNGFTGEIYIDNLKKYVKKELKNFDIKDVPPYLEKPHFEDISYEEVKSAIIKYRNNNFHKNDKLEGNLLSISQLDKVYPEYTKVSVLIYLNKAGEIELRVYEKQTRRQEYEDILLKMYNERNTHIFDLDEREKIDDVVDKHFYSIIPEEIKDDAAAYTSRSMELDKEIEQLKTQLTEYTSQEYEVDEEIRGQITEIKSQIEERENERSGATRVLSTYDHRPLLLKALNEARNTVVIISPWIKRGGLNGEILNLIRKAVSCGVRVIIGYGISEENSSDKWILKELEAIKNYRAKGKLEVYPLNNTHEKVLLMDNQFLVVTSFNWLSFGGNPRKGFRQETGIYTEAIETICAMKADIESRMEITL